MKYVCKECEKSFNLDSPPKLCPYCGCKDVGNKSRITAEQLITDYKESKTKMTNMQKQLNKLMEEFIPIYLESEKIYSNLKVYKSRGIITDKELPIREKPIIQSLVHKYPDISSKVKEKEDK
jgi:DNA-directed RNA polymerase subunit RPC12/RpoP